MGRGKLIRLVQTVTREIGAGQEARSQRRRDLATLAFGGPDALRAAHEFRQETAAFRQMSAAQQHEVRAKNTLQREDRGRYYSAAINAANLERYARGEFRDSSYAPLMLLRAAHHHLDAANEKRTRNPKQHRAQALELIDESGLGESASGLIEYAKLYADCGDVYWASQYFARFQALQAGELLASGDITSLARMIDAARAQELAPSRGLTV